MALQVIGKRKGEAQLVKITKKDGTSFEAIQVKIGDFEKLISFDMTPFEVKYASTWLAEGQTQAQR